MLAFSVCLFHGPSTAHALPAFARQTKMECWACHIGSFGPQLTPVGRNFKLNGYALSAADDLQKAWQGLSGMVQAGFERTGKAQPPATPNFKTNDHVAVDQASLFYAGRVLPNIGIFSQATYDAIADRLSWDNVDVRYANNTTLGNKGLIYGVTVNNNPSVQDLWQTTPAWAFPFVTSGLAPTPKASPFMAQLGQTVGGAGVYSMWDDLLYTELSGYTSLADTAQRDLGEAGVSASDHLQGIAPYWRAVLHFQHNTGLDYFSIGTFGMNSSRYPDNERSMGTDDMLDTALDATYQFVTPNGDHNISLYGAYLHERQDLKATHALGRSSRAGDSLDSLTATASYYYKNAYGLTLSRFDITGSSDTLLYPSPANHRPDSAGWRIQIDASPFGHGSSPGFPYLNARFFAQYTAYDKFDGLRYNYDGLGRNASDNNTLYTGVWFEF